MLRVSGPKSRIALERICPLDLHPSTFPQGRVARTLMEHLGVIILHEGPDTYLLLSARSSAGSFLHAVETSVRNVV
jgi:sarcosine oxidase subunit gamma